MSDARQSSLYSSQLTFRPPLFYIGDSIRKGKYIYKSISFPIILPRGSIDDVNNQLGKQDCVPSLYIQTRARTCPQLTMIDSDTPITRVLYIFFGFHVIALELSMSTVTPPIDWDSKTLVLAKVYSSVVVGAQEISSSQCSV